MKQTLRRDDIPNIFRKILEHINNKLPFADSNLSLVQF